ncbi:MAG: hypothetical protein M3Y82_06205 [Verrucomicrobiota bacterium]|nr:hypothetical protein [Verrucomicrobiota bacterium]
MGEKLPTQYQIETNGQTWFGEYKTPIPSPTEPFTDVIVSSLPERQIYEIEGLMLFRDESLSQWREALIETLTKKYGFRSSKKDRDCEFLKFGTNIELMIMRDSIHLTYTDPKGVEQHEKSIADQKQREQNSYQEKISKKLS